ncbi:MAG TPA: dihydrolipoyl dehydrogenase [Burkholderiaceae bacterium]|nr:dihydrolipoyl dehydrogenase [Burkholderiaceae bacterium]
MTVQITVPDIGDFADVEVIEVLVSEGDELQTEQGIVTVESDKASMELPADQPGKVVRVLVKVGDKVNQGTPLVEIEPVQAQSGAATPATPASAPATPAPAQKPAATGSAQPAAQAASRYDGQADLECDVLVLGAGPGGYSAAFRAADLGLKVVLVERYSTLGGVCLNVGCIPSKALLHSVSVLDEARAMADHGIAFGEPTIDLDKLRAYKDGVIGKLTNGLAGMAKARKVQVVQGQGKFVDAFHLQVEGESGRQVVKFRSAIIAAGSESVKLPFLPKDERIVDSTGALKLKAIPERMLIIGGGIIGLEMGTVYSSLGARLDVVEMLPGLMPGADRDLVKVWEKMNARRFDRIMLETRTVSAEARDDGIWVSFEGKNAPEGPQRYDLVLQAVGRRPNGASIGADAAGVAVDERGFIAVDRQMRTNVPHIYAIGDIVGQPMLAHKAVHEGHVAAEAIAGEKSFFDARVIPSVAYTDPEIAWVGLTEEEARKQGIQFNKGVFPWAASGRAIANGRDEGFTKLLFDADTGRILGGGIVGTHAGDLISEVVLAVEMGADAVDIGKTIHPHPTLGESVGMAAEVAKGSCTDLPPQRKK